MVPPLWRAYSQLKMKVRALPTCRNPVGDGAKRTRGFENDVDSGMVGQSPMVRGREKYRQASPESNRSLK
jgi:hypothetical protein